jgi:hypothetical protein
MGAKALAIAIVPNTLTSISRFRTFSEFSERTGVESIDHVVGVSEHGLLDGNAKRLGGSPLHTVAKARMFMMARIGHAPSAAAPLHSSPAIWSCTRARPGANIAAKWGMNWRTAATSGVGDRVINLRMNMGDTMMLGRGRCREDGAENNRSGKRNFCPAEHSVSPG